MSSLEFEKDYLKETKMSIYRGLIYELEDLMNQQFVQTENGETLRVEVSPRLTDVGGRFGRRYGTYAQVLNLALIGMMSNYFPPDYIHVLLALTGNRVSLPEARVAVERMALNYSVSTPIDSMDKLYAEQVELFDTLSEKINQQDERLESIFNVLLQAAAFNAGPMLRGTKEENRAALQNTKTQETKQLLQEFQMGEKTPKKSSELHRSKEDIREKLYGG